MSNIPRFIENTVDFGKYEVTTRLFYSEAKRYCVLLTARIHTGPGATLSYPEDNVRRAVSPVEAFSTRKMRKVYEGLTASNEIHAMMKEVHRNVNRRLATSKKVD